MDEDVKLSCALCLQSKETKTTGVLSTKDEVTAHQNCLLFSSGLFCRNTPEFDDLFGFSVEDVMSEVKRGRHLICNRCKVRGATAGCEVKRCKKSYHYPCAVRDRAKIVEDAAKEKYVLYCTNHDPQTQGNSAGRPLVCSSDSNSSGSATLSSSKRRLSYRHKRDGTPAKRRANGCSVLSTDDSSDSDANEPDSGMSMFAPLETDLDDFDSLSFSQLPHRTPPTVTVSQLFGTDSESTTESTSGNQLQDERRDGNKEGDETSIPSDTESESLLPPSSRSLPATTTTTAAVSTQTAPTLLPTVVSCKVEEEEEQSADEGPSFGERPVHSSNHHNAVPQQSPAGHPPSADHTPDGSDVSSAVPETVPLRSSCPPSPPTPPPAPELSGIDSSSFWESCNAAGCTQAIFTGFINQINDISCRIQSDQASQEDCDLALTVMTASGKLEELVAKQQEELQGKRMELQQAAAALDAAASALRR
ncbi:actin cytoskeleton-regulatory complex protein PAN1 [Cottoperca gobio]|uniref:Actin cytoskeleton-regulatory complex protein PAN1 n=1 Tax=Cottoperca gobio TaxID=56716 RepID=A0A6J2S043_COTGO|nr:PHD finger protein 11 [Cottoperca gobio]